MTIALDDKWIWDSWYAHDGVKWHGYFLQADKSLGNPDLRHFNVSQGHAVSNDLTSWEHLGTCFAPAEREAWDDYTTWTGSVVQDDTGQWHLFYTGSRRSEDGLCQRIGHAISQDMHGWERVDNGFCLDLTGPNASLYETVHKQGVWHDRAMRDPWVMRDPDGDGWLMYFTARLSGVEEGNAGGTIGFATSPDLKEWTLQPPVFEGGAYGQMEVPQVFEVNGLWYCLFCTAAEHWSQAEAARIGPAVSGNHYLISDNARGPFRLPDAPFFDGAIPCKRYAARILQTEDRLTLLGFADGGRDNFGGYVMNPQSLWQDENGNLTFEAPQTAAVGE